MSSSDDFYFGKFPDDFIWGMANSSYQTEGAWDEDGKGESIWDRFCHSNPNNIKDCSNGDVAMDSYHKYREDVKLLKDMNAKMYRFSISWPRILPKGTLEVINEPGIQYYNNLINELLKNGIEPCVTLFHWDLPQQLQDIGGWENDELVTHFQNFSKLCFQRFGNQVKFWITINEPWVYSMRSFNDGAFAPGKKEPLEAPYKIVHNQIKSHAMTYRLYEKEFKLEQKGWVGIAVDSSNYSPMNEDLPEDKAAADKAYQFRLGWILGPIFFGDYPEVMKKCIEQRSKGQGLDKSRLPSFDSHWEHLIKGSVDFIGLNYYTSELVTPIKEGQVSETCLPGWNEDLGTHRMRDPRGNVCGIHWQRNVPWGLRRTLNWIKDSYGNPRVMITENGMSRVSDDVDDDDRVDFFRDHINETLKALELDGCNVVGYLGWCLLDVFEWADGHSIGFGVHKVDRSHPDRTRTAKKSSKFLAKVFSDNGFTNVAGV